MQMQTQLQPGLYLVATPIGNLRDITLRALDILAAADAILCEDTRTSGKLLKAYDIYTKTIPYHDHSNEAARTKILDRLQNGEALALISDAGMPLISDPGYKLVQECLEAGIAVTSAPGANAALMALQLSGIPSDKFTFLGFAPPKQAGRRKIVQEWQSAPSALVFYEGASRVEKLLADIKDVLGTRKVSVCRELTKLYEEVLSGSAEEILNQIQERGSLKGEFVIIIAPPENIMPDEAEIDDMLKDALADHSVKEAAALVAEKTGLKKSALYDRALDLKNAN